MKFFRPSVFIVLSLLGCGLLSSPARAYTSSDYYNAGLQLYNAKNYPQAVQYFGAAISLDPNNAAALQGRANSYYALGQYPQALDDYQKVQALQPSPPLAAMIQALQAKVGAGSPALPPGANGAPPVSSPSVPGGPLNDSFAQGVALFQQHQYAQAVPLFQTAVQENPEDAKAYYYLGVAQMQSGDMKDAAVALGISNKLNPNPSVAAYVDQIKAYLSRRDQKWVDKQIRRGGGPEEQAASKRFGIRLEPALFAGNLKDFNNDAEYDQTFIRQEQQTDPSLTYNATVPTGYLGIGVEPVVRLGSSFELGIPLAILPVGEVSESATGSQQGNDFSQSYTISAISIGLTGRYLIGLGKGLQLFVGGGPCLIPVIIDYNLSTPSGLASGTFTSVGFGGQIQLGLDWHLGSTFVVSPFGGFQFASASAFTGTITGSGNGGTPVSETGQLEVTTNSNGSAIYFLQNGQTAINTNDRPAQVDLSGPFGGIQLSAFF
jgi:tetratricopeptide (TPR) repeat protein